MLSKPPSESPSFTFNPSSLPSESLTGSTAPTDCYDMHGVTEDDIIKQVGLPEPIPEGAINIIQGANVNVTIGM